MATKSPTCHLASGKPRPWSFEDRPNILAGACSGETIYAIIKFPLTTELDRKKLEDFNVDGWAHGWLDG